MYILFIADFDEGESKVLKFEYRHELQDYLGNNIVFDDLTQCGEHIGEWHHYHLEIV